jgi:hypothetical protein
MLLAALVARAAVVQAAPAPDSLRVGSVLPRLEGAFLTGRKAVLPAAAEGKVALVLVGFTYQSRFPVESWAEWYRRSTRGDRTATLFEVPMIGGPAKLGKCFIDSGMRKETPVELHENVITVYSGSGDWKKRAGFSSSSENDAFLVLLDRSGVVRWMHYGPFDRARAGELARVMASLGVVIAAQDAPVR